MVTRVDRRTALRFIAGLALGWATSWAVLTGGFSVLRVVWPDYALAEPEKAYVWDDYPVWYHLVYLFSILPIAVCSGLLARERSASNRAVVASSAAAAQGSSVGPHVRRERT